MYASWQWIHSDEPALGVEVEVEGGVAVAAVLGECAPEPGGLPVLTSPRLGIEYTERVLDELR